MWRLRKIVIPFVVVTRYCTFIVQIKNQSNVILNEFHKVMSMWLKFFPLKKQKTSQEKMSNTWTQKIIRNIIWRVRQTIKKNFTSTINNNYMGENFLQLIPKFSASVNISLTSPVQCLEIIPIWLLPSAELTCNTWHIISTNSIKLDSG